MNYSMVKDTERHSHIGIPAVSFLQLDLDARTVQMAAYFIVRLLIFHQHYDSSREVTCSALSSSVEVHERTSTPQLHLTYEGGRDCQHLSRPAHLGQPHVDRDARLCTFAASEREECGEEVAEVKVLPTGQALTDTLQRD